MFNKFLKISYFLIIIFFFSFVLSTYFSKINSVNTLSNVHNNQRETKLKSGNLPFLYSDTENVIVYNSSEFIEKKIKKRKIWELLK